MKVAVVVVVVVIIMIIIVNSACMKRATQKGQCPATAWIT